MVRTARNAHVSDRVCRCESHKCDPARARKCTHARTRTHVTFEYDAETHVLQIGKSVTFAAIARGNTHTHTRVCCPCALDTEGVYVPVLVRHLNGNVNIRECLMAFGIFGQINPSSPGNFGNAILAVRVEHKHICNSGHPRFVCNTIRVPIRSESNTRKKTALELECAIDSHLKSLSMSLSSSSSSHLARRYHHQSHGVAFGQRIHRIYTCVPRTCVAETRQDARQDTRQRTT